MQAQSWKRGQVVKVGFVSGLEVCGVLPAGASPQGTWPQVRGVLLHKAGTYYDFRPHAGLYRMEASEVQAAIAAMVIE
jgi:hypothetical protein